MFNMGFTNSQGAMGNNYTGTNNAGNANNGNNISFSNNSGTNNIFSNYPNISPANGMMGGNTNSGSPTSNLFPSITSLFQSPIGTPRVTPTPQHLAAYFFNEDQFHSLIFNPNSSLSNSNDISNMISNFTNSELSNNLSPLPLFNNLISTSMLNSQNNMGHQQNGNGNIGNTNSGNVNQMLNISNQQQIGQDASGGGKMVNMAEVTNTGVNGNENNPLHTPKNNLLSANN